MNPPEPRTDFVSRDPRLARDLELRRIALEADLRQVEARVNGHASGPRNPAPTPRKRARQCAKASRKRNR